MEDALESLRKQVVSMSWDLEQQALQTRRVMWRLQKLGAGPDAGVAAGTRTGSGSPVSTAPGVPTELIDKGSSPSVDPVSDAILARRRTAERAALRQLAERRMPAAEPIVDLEGGEEEGT